MKRKKVRKPRNRDVIKLPPTYSPSPERSVRNTSGNKEVQYNSQSLCNNKEASQSARTPLRLDLSVTRQHIHSEKEIKEKCDSAPVVRGDRTARDEMMTSLSLSSPRLARRHHKQDCLLQETLLLNQSRNFPQLKSENQFENDDNRELDLPEYSLRKQRRPSISLPDLRAVSGFLVNSGSSTPTSGSGDISRENLSVKSADDDFENDDVFSCSCPDTRKKTRPIFKRQTSERQVTFPEIHTGKTNLSSPAHMRREKCSSSDDQLQRSLLK